MLRALGKLLLPRRFQTERQQVVLIAECNFPRPLHDAGSVETVALIDALSDLGFSVVFLALGEFFLPSEQRDAEARTRLEARGVRCLAPSPGEAETETDGIILALASIGHVDACVLARVCCGGAIVDRLQTAFPSARFLFLPHDLHFLREEREAAINGNVLDDSAIHRTREQERRLIEICDVTLLLSHHEIKVVRELSPAARCIHLPLTRSNVAFAAPSGRHDLAFIGNFAHRPNGDAVRHFLTSLWPVIAAQSALTRFHVIGANPPEWLTDLRSERIVVRGHVPDLDAYLRDIRLTVAPLRYGAGAKGKVISSLAQGVPCVMSDIAAEGIVFPDAMGAFCRAETDDGFAKLCLTLLEDDALWQRISDDGVRMVMQAHGPDVLKAQLRSAFEEVGLLPGAVS